MKKFKYLLLLLFSLVLTGVSFSTEKNNKVKNCIILIDETEYLEGAVHATAQSAFLNNTPIIISKKILLSIHISAYNLFKEIPEKEMIINPESNSIDELNLTKKILKTCRNKIALQYGINLSEKSEKKAMNSYLGFIFVSILKNNYFLSKWKIYEPQKNSSYVLLLPNGATPKSCCFSEKLTENEFITKALKNKDLEKLTEMYDSITDEDFNNKKLNQIEKIFNKKKKNWVLYIFGHGEYRSSICGEMGTDFFVKNFLMSISRRISPKVIFITSCFFGGENFHLAFEKIKSSKEFRLSCPIVSLAGGDQQARSVSGLLLTKEEILNNKSSCENRNQSFPIKLDLDLQTFLDKINKFYSSQIELPAKEHSVIISKLLKNYYLENETESYNLASFIIPESKYIWEQNNKDNIKFIGKAKLEKLKNEKKSLIKITNKKVAIIGENQNPITFKILNSIPQMILIKRNPHSYDHTYEFNSIIFENKNSELVKIKNENNSKSALTLFMKKSFVNEILLFNKKKIKIKLLKINNFKYKNVLLNQNSGVVSYETSNSNKKYCFNILNENEQKALMNQLEKELFRSIKSNDHKNVKRLLAEGVNVQAKNLQDDTPLQFACNTPEPNLEIIRILIKNGANINKADNSGKTCLMNLAIYGCLDAIKFLITMGADISLQDYLGLNAASYAESCGNSEIVNYFSKLGLEPPKFKN